jgi:hypothetical protein
MHVRTYYADEPELRRIIEHYEDSTDAELAAEDMAAERLVLAAPELPNVCKSALALVTARTNGNARRGGARAVAQTVRRAIARVEGRRKRDAAAPFAGARRRLPVDTRKPRPQRGSRARGST